MAVSDMIPPPATPAFLARAGWGDAQVLPLAGDASFRRYFRVAEPGRSAVLMDAPPDKEDSRPFLAVARHLNRLGFAAPIALAVDLDAGLVLLEDFGNARVNPVLAADPAQEEAIYEAAIDLLVALHRHPPCDVPPYDEAVLLREVALLTDWYLEGGVYNLYTGAWSRVFAASGVAESRNVLVLRDYHADNLMLLDRPGLQRLGLLDFQDALAGHPAYDLVSLLQDARRDVDPGLEERMIERYLAATGLDRDSFRAAYEVLGAQRNTKILGIFSRLAKRDGKTHYLDMQPRVAGYLRRNLAHPALAPVRDWFAANAPEIVA